MNLQIDLDTDIYESYDREMKDNYKANKTICTLCNYILKLTSDEKAIKKAVNELSKAKKKIEHIEDMEELAGKLLEFAS